MQRLLPLQTGQRVATDRHQAVVHGLTGTVRRRWAPMDNVPPRRYETPAAARCASVAWTARNSLMSPTTDEITIIDAPSTDTQ